MENLVDLRKLNRGEILKIRNQVVRLKERGLSGAQIETMLGIRQNRISEIWRLYLKEGASGLLPCAPGRKQGEKTLLSASLEREIRQILLENLPDRVDMPYSLWTRYIVRDFIRDKYGIRLSLRCMTDYLKRWGFVCETPIKQAKDGENVKLLRFINEAYPAIVRKAAKKNVGIYWYVESALDSVIMSTAITSRGTARFMFFKGSRSSQEKFIVFLTRLTRYADRKIFLIAENRKSYRGEKVAVWLKGKEDRIEVLYHPAINRRANIWPRSAQGDSLCAKTKIRRQGKQEDR